MKILFIIPGDINLPTGGYRYDRAILQEWSKSEIDYELLSLPGDYPQPSDAACNHAVQQIETLLGFDIAVIDGLAGGVLPDFIEALKEHMPVVSLIHHPLCLENGLDAETSEQLKLSENAGLKHVTGIITTSPATTKTVAELFNFPTTNIQTVLPGVERGQPSKGRPSDTLNLLCIGSIIERKNHRTLIKALASLKHLDWHLDCIGMAWPQEPLYQELMDLLDAQDLQNRVTFHGAVDEADIESAYHKADIFILPSLYEGYGMAYAEAIVRGIPVIGTKAGAVPDTVPEICGILVEPQDIEQLQKAIETMITDGAVRETFAQNCINAEPNFPTWKNSAKQFAKFLESKL